MKDKIVIKKSQLILAAAIVISALGLQLWQTQWKDINLKLKGESLNILLAKTPVQQYKGLGGRKDLGEHDGMLFVSPVARKIGIVMRGMEFPLDIVWFLDGEVVDFAPNVPIEPGIPNDELRVYYPRKEANAVIEFRAGWTLEHSLKIGDKLYASE